MSLNYGVFGVGRIGRVHAAIVREQGHAMIALGDEAVGAIDVARSELQLPDVPSFDSPAAMVAALGDTLDAVIIAIARPMRASKTPLPINSPLW